MPSQQVEIAETIAAVKRALRREKQGVSDQLITAASNRGNKLQIGANHVHQGALAYVKGSEVYKKAVSHAGFTRYIVGENPPRYNEFGDELEASESDEEADDLALEENAYSDVRLEGQKLLGHLAVASTDLISELLCPLKHPSQLSSHPTMSHAYLDRALPDMVKATQDKLRQERANLWQAKRLNRQLVGDESWIPCERVESTEDWNLFEPRIRVPEINGTKRRRVGESNGAKQLDATEVIDHATSTNGYSKLETKAEVAELPASPNNHPADNENMTMTDNEIFNASKNDGQAEVDSALGPESSADEQPEPAKHGPEAKLPAGVNRLAMETSVDQAVSPEKVHQVPETVSAPLVPENAKQAVDEPETRSESEADEASPPPPPRRITRALAANNNSGVHSSAPTPPLSPTSTISSPSDSSLLQIDPLFLLPPELHHANRTAALYGLPSDEALETRRLLTMYIQKQEECVRGYEAVFNKLLKAQRLRVEVLEMCKAEGHVGELSDGEDWIDYEYWGLVPGELKKGRDEDEEPPEEATIGGRKGKRRARN